MKERVIFCILNIHVHLFCGPYYQLNTEPEPNGKHHMPHKTSDDHEVRGLFIDRFRYERKMGWSEWDHVIFPMLAMF